MRWVILVFLVLAMSGCGRQGAHRAPPGGPLASARADVNKKEEAVPVGTGLRDHVIGAPRVFDGLSIFPIFATEEVDVGPMTTLDQALKAGKAEVRELGTEGSLAGDRQLGGPQVNQLVIENRGELPIYVLAGTVVKGGNQDRQIGQDFVIDPRTTTAVDAFCVEHGRWNGTRDGRATGGRFGVARQMVSGSIRAAAQYEKNQGDVWSEVAKVNGIHRKSAASGTFAATLDAPDVQQGQAALAEKARAILLGAEPQAKLVGFAFGVEGKVKAVRWFASHYVFELYRDMLLDAAALDAITTRAQRSGDEGARDSAPSVDAILALIEKVEMGISEERATEAGNANHYKSSPSGYGSKTFRKAAAKSATPARPISVDYLAR